MSKIISLFLLSLLILECTFSENTEAGNLAKVFREMDRNGKYMFQAHLGWFS
jgi:hypothetical protein